MEVKVRVPSAASRWLVAQAKTFSLKDDGKGFRCCVNYVAQAADEAKVFKGGKVPSNGSTAGGGADSNVETRVYRLAKTQAEWFSVSRQYPSAYAAMHVVTPKTHVEYRAF